jgi:hypothetical protein
VTRYFYKFVDATDSNHGDGVISFEKTLADHERFKTIRFHMGDKSDVKPEIVLKDGPFDPINYGDYVSVKFKPRPPDRGKYNEIQTGDLLIRLPSRRSEYTIPLAGEAVRTEKWYVDRSVYFNALQQIFNTSWTGQLNSTNQEEDRRLNERMSRNRRFLGRPGILPISTQPRPTWSSKLPSLMPSAY